MAIFDNSTTVGFLFFIELRSVKTEPAKLNDKQIRQSNEYRRGNESTIMENQRYLDCYRV